MVDIHCHIIPSIDDGSKSFEETIKMAKKAESLGYDKIIATPHYIDSDVTYTLDFMLEAVESLNKELEKNNINVKVYNGNEIFFTNNVYGILANKKASTIGNTNYVLMEFPMYSPKPLNMKNEVYNLIASGYIPIIAHPERYSFVTKNYKDLYEIIEMGALMQVNIGSISGTYGKDAKKNIKRLLRKNMVHFIATDSHDSERIYSIYEKCLKKIRRIIGSKNLSYLLDNGDKILKNESIMRFKK